MESELDQDEMVHRGIVPYRDQRDLETNLMNKKSCIFLKTRMVLLTSGPMILSFIYTIKY